MSANFAVGAIELDRPGRSVKIGGEPLVLTNTEFEILAYLMVHAGKAVSREQLFETVWGYDLKFSSNSLEVLMYRLRGKISAAGGGDVIKTLRGFGYRLQVEE
jgi:DNA-binding response OmpR family regulator